MRNQSSSRTSPRRGQKGRKTNANRNGQQSRSANGQRQRSSRGKSRNEISKAWASDTSTLSSHMPSLHKGERDSKGKKSDFKNGNGGTQRARGKNKPGGGKNRSGKNERHSSRNKQHSRSQTESAQQPTPASRQTASSSNGQKRVGNLEPFELFCAYHLGITPDNTYRTSNINEVAKRFNSNPATIKQALKEYDMSPESLLDRDFDMALAQLDIQVAPEGVDRIELAKGLYEEFLEAPRIKRDWKKILEEDRKENQKIFRD